MDQQSIHSRMCFGSVHAKVQKQIVLCLTHHESTMQTTFFMDMFSLHAHSHTMFHSKPFFLPPYTSTHDNNTIHYAMWISRSSRSLTMKICYFIEMEHMNSLVL